MPLIQVENAHLSFGEHNLLDTVNFVIEEGDRIGLIGRNGEGKSTLMKVLMEAQAIDDGRLLKSSGLKIAYLAQSLPAADGLRVDEFIRSGVPELVQSLADFERLSLTVGNEDRLAQLQTEIEVGDGWTLDTRVTRLMREFGFSNDQRLSELSGGWRRKAALARALISAPDLLLLDEPTNHLDISLIAWLEQYLTQSFPGALVVITHDRRFLQAVSNRIFELDRGHLRQWSGDYKGFIKFREAELEAEERADALFDKKLAQEEVWIRQGIKARRTRNEGRVRALKKMRDERAKRRIQSGSAKMEISVNERSGKRVAEIFEACVSYDGQTIIRDFSSNIIRGDKIGLIGPNGAGKSTLLKLIVGEIEPDRGSVSLGTKLEVAYFDQLHSDLNLDVSVLDNIAEGRDSVTINGKERHVLSYLKDFLFDAKRARTPVKALSGGERARVILAKLFCKPSNLLIMDEPTNDLDTETLELLESLLVEYTGTVLLVSHDREFLDNVVTSSIVFEGRGKLSEYVGGYEDWIRQGGLWPTEFEQAEVDKASKTVAQEREIENKISPKKLSYKLQRELDGLPEKIELLESELESLNAEVCAVDFYQREEVDVKKTLDQLAKTETDLQQAYERWEQLDAM
jgi:ATP-binding cassette subfamily F protein uup